MYWNSMRDFFNMGGYGLYVWVSFGVTFGCMAIELFILRASKIANKKIKDLL